MHLCMCARGWALVQAAMYEPPPGFAMRRIAIPGRLDLAALGRLHRPADRATLRVAAVELARRGLTPGDISATLGITEPAARLLLAPPESLRGDPCQ